MQREPRLTERVAWGIEVASAATVAALYLPISAAVRRNETLIGPQKSLFGPLHLDLFSKVCR